MNNAPDSLVQLETNFTLLFFPTISLESYYVEEPERANGTSFDTCSRQDHVPHNALLRQLNLP